MAAPPNPRLAAKLTTKILDTHFTDEISLGRYQTYIWLTHVLLSGGWFDMSDDKYTADRSWVTNTLDMWDELQPWLVSREFTEDDVKAHEVTLALFPPPMS